jgi:hypothetical protein
MIIKYKLFLEKIKLSKKLKNPDYSMSRYEFLKHATQSMPDELLEMIYKWGFIKKSPYGHSYYNKRKDWNGFVDGGIRISDHWNFFAKGNVHCKTKTPVKNNKYWYVGKYYEISDNYEIIGKYPILNRKRNDSEFISKNYKNLKDKIHNELIPSDEERQKVRDFKQRIRDNKVNAKLQNEEIVIVKWRGIRGTKKNKHFVIKYMDKGKLIETPDYELIDEIIDK